MGQISMYMFNEVQPIVLVCIFRPISIHPTRCIADCKIKTGFLHYVRSCDDTALMDRRLFSLLGLFGLHFMTSFLHLH